MTTTAPETDSAFSAASADDFDPDSIPSDLCVAERHDPGTGDSEPPPRPLATPSLRLCPACVANLQAALRALPGLWSALGAVLVPRRPRGAGDTSPPGNARRADQPAPIDLGAAALRDQLAHDIAFWCRFVADERGLTGPGATDPAARARWLARHTEWIAAHRIAAREAPPVLAELSRRARTVIDPDTRRVALGVHAGCPGPGPGPADPPGRLTATVPVRGSNPAQGATVRCSGCDLIATPADWAGLCPEAGAEEATATAAEVASAFGSTVSAVYRRASVERWRRVKAGGRFSETRYLLADATRSFTPTP